MADLILRGGTVIDGTGSPRFRGDVAIEGDRIVRRSGDVSKMAGAREIDVSGKIVAPGFIDVHTHDDRALFAAPDMAAKASQGVTTVITGNCGISLAPLTPDERPPPPLDLIGEQGDYRYPRFADYLAALDRDAGRDQRRLPCRAFDVAGRRDARVRPAGARGRDRSDGRAVAGGARRRRGRDVHGAVLCPGVSRTCCRDRGAGEAVAAGRRSLYDAYARRDRACARQSRRELSCRRERRRAGRDLAPQGHRGREFRPHRRDSAEDRGGDAAPGDRARRLSVYCLLDGAAHGADRGRAEGHDHLVEAAPGAGRARPRRYRARLGRRAYSTRRRGCSRPGRSIG